MRRQRLEWQLRTETSQCPTCCRWGAFPQVYCSDSCRLFWTLDRSSTGIAFARGIARPNLIRRNQCAWCAESFQVHGRWISRFCSPGCRNLAAGTQRSTDRMCRLEYRDCACGQTFTVTNGQQTLCPDCRRDEKQRRNRSARHRDYVLTRDRWTCHLCSGRISKQAEYPDLQSASIDHLIPKSVPGSSDEPVNLAAAHLGCNIRRRTGGVAQLRLVG